MEEIKVTKLKADGILNNILDIAFEDVPIESAIRICEHCGSVVMLKESVGDLDGEMLAKWFAIKAKELRETKRAKKAFYNAV